MNHPSRRLPGALILASSLVGLALAGPVTAAPAPLIFTVDNLSPDVVSQGQLGAFHLTASNPSDNTSNISQLYLTEKSGASVYAIQNSRPGTCPPSGQLLCNFGALRPGESVEITVALVAPAASTWHVDFEFSSTGYVIGTGKNKSHGDLFFKTFDISTPGSGADSAGTYVWDESHRSFHNGLALGNGNKQSSSLTVFNSSFPASVADGSGLTITCPTGSEICPGTFFGEVTEVFVDNGNDQLIHLVIQMYKPGRNPNQVNGVYHQYTTGTDPNIVVHEELLPVCGDTPVAPCFKATKLGSNNLQLDVWLTHNGKVGGF